MRVLEGSYLKWATDRESALTVGVLDGVHRGHRKLLSRLPGHDLAPTVATFEPHPVEVLVPGSDPRLLTTLDERIRLLSGLGVEQVAVLDLGEIRELSPEQFVAQILVERLRARHVVAGVDFQFGKNRVGTVAMLSAMSVDFGYVLEVVDLVVEEGVISSSRIRGMIEAGDVGGAAELLGSPYTLTNTVLHGDQRGRVIGFPTANIEPVPRKVLPGNGVYAAVAQVDGVRHRAAVNVGVRPTFSTENPNVVVEAHIMDFDADLYGRSLTVEFVARIRDELKFDSVDDLVSRMREDVVVSREILAEI